jgi:hypothetical protein
LVFRRASWSALFFCALSVVDAFALHFSHTALAMTKMAFMGEIEDVLDTVMANWRELV